MEEDKVEDDLNNLRGKISKPTSSIELTYSLSTPQYKRDSSVSVYALQEADYKCEVDENHKTFMRRKNYLPYVEAHYLFPMSAQGQYALENINLDIPENVVSLCSNCHKEIHFGRDCERLIEILYNKRRVQLENNGITMSLQELLKLY